MNKRIIIDIFTLKEHSREEWDKYDSPAQMFASRHHLEQCHMDPSPSPSFYMVVALGSHYQFCCKHGTCVICPVPC